MMSFESERFSMRPLQVEDEQFFISLYRDPNVMKHIAAPFSMTQAEEFFNAALNVDMTNDIRQIIWVIIDKQTQEKLGIQSIIIFSKKQKNAEAGLILIKEVHGKGYAVELFKRMIEFGLNELHLPQIDTFCDSKNLPAVKGILAVGFVKISEAEQSHFSIDSARQ
ncbi:GNAT family N-acetyltransferase [Shewanella sp. 1_MG-2023]|uniref:GNAT family N-acetyltransferase n=1 Tax=unclassified Shewanella TaxID=196818 RepID=UPI0026E19BF6|nr:MULTISPECIES: GNAT family N-acetyltransferase [unclassified Shewanella]MDO6613825.1 GNAT family N-acetyltransferase [Shewanella sp. 7_MG-2023]MDO6773575.1 GNAT family N-acetyltransferase [Shewanella sp. 2_MG-2023]MDO6796432.1 GNAT family N-acetyltransferase [Shewanella sp. 1_MG-2023]